ncbi:hypothetical protein ACA910_017681 [Epithemia clementina (nom. ined.)]
MVVPRWSTHEGESGATATYAETAGLRRNGPPHVMSSSPTPDLNMAAQSTTTTSKNDTNSGNWFASSSFSWNTLGSNPVATSPASTYTHPAPESNLKVTPAHASSLEANNASSWSWFSSPFDLASESFNYAAEATYSTLASTISSVYKDSNRALGADSERRSVASWSSLDSPNNIDANPFTTTSHPSLILKLQRQQGRRQRKRAQSRRSNMTALDWTSTLLQNPYQSVRGRHAHERQSMSAIRSFISLVPDVNPQQLQGMDTDDHMGLSSSLRSIAVPGEVHQHRGQRVASTGTAGTMDNDVGMPLQDSTDDESSVLPKRSGTPLLESSWSEHQHLSMSFQEQQQHKARTDATSETAAHLAEGTLRAWRDMALEEAVELNSALMFWSDRWERPGLSFLEAGPLVWLSEGGYNHRQIGKRVAQSQAVLARRCTAIGELQQHLLKAGWQRGVAQWSVLGQGGHWWDRVAPGFDGSIQPEDEVREQADKPQKSPAVISGIGGTQHKDQGDDDSLRQATRQEKLRKNSRSPSSEMASVLSNSREGRAAIIRPKSLTNLRKQQSERSLGRAAIHESTNDLKKAEGAGVHVRNRDGGGTFVDDPLFLAKWSVDAIALVRRQLNRACKGTIPLPHTSNWVSGSDDDGHHDYSLEGHGEDENVIVPPEPPKSNLPLWAIDAGQTRNTEWEASGEDPDSDSSRVMIADLPALTAEVSELLNTMEDVMDVQRERRLDRLQPPNWWRRNWYILATSVPFAVWLVRHGRFRILLSSIVRTVKYFVVTRIKTPMVAIFEEIWKGRASFSDKKARMEAIEVLKQMIKSWLDDSYPNMPEKERQRLADAMDVSLVEKMKAEYMDSLGLNTLEVVRMSFIEMQWLKKEMMNALHAMDEVMSANDINMNLAAITPVFMIVYVQTRIIRYLFYALLRLGKSREETYASFRAILLDIERLLVMRDNPPDTRGGKADDPRTAHDPSVLGADDLGMLMLLIHECRTIMWREQRRFSANMIRSVNEDLSELAGERGAVSIKQQLQIVARMTRSYPFLKVISTGHYFEHHSQLRRE